jgi:three-Cys-motif partner protein
VQKAIEKPDYAERLVTIFNDKDEENVRTLEAAVGELPGIGNLAYKPEIWNEEVGDKIAQHFQEIRTIPILAFIDPWGYKGLTLRLVNASSKIGGVIAYFSSTTTASTWG